MSSILKALEKKTHSRKPRVEEGFYRPPAGREPGKGNRSLIILGIIVVGLLGTLVGLAVIEGLSKRATPEETTARIEPRTIPPTQTPLPAPPAQIQAQPDVKRDEQIESLTAEITRMKELLEEVKKDAEDRRNTQPVTVVVPGLQWPGTAQSAPPAGDPESPAAKPNPEPTVVAPTATPRKPEFRLSGTVNAPGRDTAFVGQAFYRVGDSVDGWKITEIGKGYIVVEGWPEKIWMQK